MLKLLLVFSFFTQAVLAVVTFKNPLKNPDGSDPFIVYDSGYYYLTTTTWNNVQITRATTLAGLKTAKPTVVYSTSTSSRCCNVWAPEIHKVNGIWYIYYTAGLSGSDLGGQRAHVLQGVAANPNGPYSYKGQLAPSNNPNAWVIDGTVLTINGANYFVFSAFSPRNLQSLYIAPMTNAYTIGAMSLLSEPTQSWETVDTPVNEGPAALYSGSRVWLAYSASFCKLDVGIFDWSPGMERWQPTYPVLLGQVRPVFSSANGLYGTAHNGFFKSPDGKETWVVYHASATNPAKCDGSRITMAQNFFSHSSIADLYPPFFWEIFSSFGTTGAPSFGSPRNLNDNVPVPSGES
ncbi:hypothetical protein CVT24_008032 [Panaeolus cyanescens]|uniref:Glycoside hydrolase family 43 protein n=1 Tax=Panaeolus cyanescens TaxID=181874 RepID=A0A409YQY1_9AGAR|nr:hypothetical protein CVT24_008032 [Panaeolus cyanescens]